MLLDRLLSALEVRIENFFICQVCPGWRLTFDPEPAETVHYVLMGAGALRIAAARPLPLRQDSFLILPRGLAHGFEPVGGATREIRKRIQPPLQDEVPIIRAGDGHGCLMTACGTVIVTYGGTVGLFEHLKEPIVESFSDNEALRGQFQRVLAELAAPTVGTGALTESLLKQCLIVLLRRQFKTNGAAPWLAALGDERLAHAVTAMLERPAEAFTLEHLAGIAGMSRSAFAKHFAATFGRPPFEFLKEVRLRRAARLLEATDLPIKAIASNVGYASRSYFSRAFRSLYGVDPATFRRGAATAGRRLRKGDPTGTP